MPQQLHQDLSGEFNFPKMEEEILAYWKDINAFKTSVKKSEGKKEFTVFDGPPFANKLPHYGHILVGTIKDVVCRYARQTGHHVNHKVGWDCHGLPIEFEVEKVLGPQGVNKLNIAEFNTECRGIVLRCLDGWEKTMGRVGRWADFKDSYKTMDLSFMESVWWVFKQLWDKELVYRGFKVMPFSTACGTPISNFEASLNYKDTCDPSIIVMFPLVEDPNTHLLVWTTAPWTLPCNVALCVNKECDYVKVLDAATQRQYILAQCRLDKVFKPKKGRKTSDSPDATFSVVENLKGHELVGKKYEPIFDYYKDVEAFVVIGADYVTADAGTGIAHAAPGFDNDADAVCRQHKIMSADTSLCPVDKHGCFTPEVSDFAGKKVNDCDAELCKMIDAKQRLFKKTSTVHARPFCWRSETPLIEKAVDAWFVRVEDIREKLPANIQGTNWNPDFVKSKRFSNWLENVEDWCVSRDRKWGTPLPIWVSDDLEEILCVGSVAELEELSGVKDIKDIHREVVDKITIPSQRQDKPPLKRIEQVFDCWFESGSMPYGQCHYPFKNGERFQAEDFTADFIAEGLDQTRGWFYTLLVLSTALFDKPPYKNVIVNGLVQFPPHRRMGARFRNIPDPGKIMDECGADALRLYLLSSPAVQAEPIHCRESGVRDIVKGVLLPLLHATKFFISNVKLFLAHEKKLDVHLESTNKMDRWILAATQTLVKHVRTELGAYRLHNVVPHVMRYIEKLTNWYVRMNRPRLKGAVGLEDWHQSLSTLFHVMLTLSCVIAPLTPFIAETIYQTIRGLVDEKDREDSVHYLMIPEVDATLFDDELEESMDAMTAIIDLVRVVRDRVKIGMKKPLKQVVVCHAGSDLTGLAEDLKSYIQHELNIIDLTKTTTEENEYLTTTLEPNVASLGKRLGKQSVKVRKAISLMSEEEVRCFLTDQGGVVDGFHLTMADVKVIYGCREGCGEHLQVNTDGSRVVIVDTTMDDATIDLWKAREFVSCVQMLRKSARLQITDVVDVYYHTEDADLAKSIENCRAKISETVKGTWASMLDPTACQGVTVIARHRTEIGGSSIELCFATPSRSL